MKASDVLQSRLRISAAMSYYVLGASGLVGVLFVPAMVGVLYQGIQRQLIDRGEMKMYGKISDMDATWKKQTNDDEDDGDDDE